MPPTPSPPSPPSSPPSRSPLPTPTPARSGRAQDVRAALQDEIESGRLPPGSVLDERALAERFGVSRTPVREALQQLAARDLVRIAPRSGVTVARLSVGTLRAVMEFLAAAAPLAARLAARRVDDELRQRLDESLARCRAAAEQGGAAEYSMANALFHEVIYAGARNPYLAQQMRRAHRMIQRYRARDFQNKVQVRQSLADHEAVARAIHEGDEAGAGQAMLAHVPSGSTGFSEFLAKVPAGFLATADDEGSGE